MSAPLRKEAVEYIIQHFKDTENKVLADAVGCSVSAINKIQHRYRLTKSREHVHRICVRCGKAGYAKWGRPPIDEDGIKRRAETFRKRYLEEKARANWGLPRKTKIHVKMEPRLKQSQRTYLVGLGYIIDRVNNIAYYTDDTKRAVRMEAYKDKKCYYKFMPYDQHQ